MDFFNVLMVEYLSTLVEHGMEHIYGFLVYT
jgi:hypothetical protein